MKRLVPAERSQRLGMVAQPVILMVEVEGF
jgi:hypothetical protein